MIRRPSLLDASLQEVARLHPTAGSVTLKMVGSSEATMTLPEDSPAAHIHDWISLYTQRGFAGYFRVTNVAQTYKKQIVLTMLHGIDILSDSVWEAQTDFSGTKAEFLRQLLSQQTKLIGGVKPWVLGKCEDSANYEKSINYDRLSNLLEELVEEGDDYVFTYDQSVFPWVLNYVAKDQAVASEFRLTRNVRTATVTFNDADLCTRLILSVNVRVTDKDTGTESTDTTIRVYNNAAAQAEWGIVVKTADVDTQDDIIGRHFPSADAWAKDFLRKRSAPTVQIQIDGDELSGITGDKWDEAAIGRLCQVALPAYGHTFRERVVSVTYPSFLGEPQRVSVSLANNLPKFSENIASAHKTASGAASAARAASRGAAKAKDLTTWSQHVKYYGEALEGTGVMTLYESGIDMDAVGGVKIFSLVEGVQALYSGITVNSRSIESVVQKTGINELGQKETLYSRITQEADRISLVVSGSGKSASIRIEAIVDAINASAVAIDADRIYLNGQVIASAISAARADIRDLTTGVTKATLINSDAIYADTVAGGTLSGGSVSIGSGASGGSGTLYYRGVQYVRQGVVLGGPGGSIAEGHFLGDSTKTLNLDHYHKIDTEESGGQIVITLGEPVATSDTSKHVANFKIADTQAYKDGVSAAKSSVTLNEPTWNAVTGALRTYRTYTVKASNNRSISQTLHLTKGSWSGDKCTVSMRTDSTAGTVMASIQVDASSLYSPYTDYTPYRIASSAYADHTLYTRSQNASGYVYTPVGTGFYKISKIADTLYTHN